jgi:hypothetical protein
VAGAGNVEMSYAYFVKDHVAPKGTNKLSDAVYNTPKGSNVSFNVDSSEEGEIAQFTNSETITILQEGTYEIEYEWVSEGFSELVVVVHPKARPNEYKGAIPDNGAHIADRSFAAAMNPKGFSDRNIHKFVTYLYKGDTIQLYSPTGLVVPNGLRGWELDGPQDRKEAISYVTMYIKKIS